MKNIAILNRKKQALDSGWHFLNNNLLFFLKRKNYFNNIKFFVKSVD